MEDSAADCSSSIQLEPLSPTSTDPGPAPITVVEASSLTEAGLEPATRAVTPIEDTEPASPAQTLLIQKDEPGKKTKHQALSYKQIAGIAVLFLLCTIAFSVSSSLLQSNRPPSDLFDPGCIDKLGDSGSPGVTKAFDLDLTFGKFTFTHAKLLDVAWDTIIGQGGRLLHGWILYRCVMRRLLIHAMEYYCVTYRYYLTISWSRASFESLCVIIRDCIFMQGVASFLCTLLLIYALSYTLLFSLLWSTATGYLSLSHRLYVMPDGNIVPLNTHDLALCWVLDGSRFNTTDTTDTTDDIIEVGPDFSALAPLTTSFKYTDTTPCIDAYYSSNVKENHSNPHSLVYTSGGWKAEQTTTIWDHFGTVNGSNNIGQSSNNFQSLRAYAITRQLLQISLDPQGWLTNGSEVELRAEVVEQNGFRLDWWAPTGGACSFRNLTNSRPILRPAFDAAQLTSPETRPIPADSQLALEFGVPETMTWTHFSLGNVSGESLPPGQMPYNSTLWLNRRKISFPAPFLDIGHGCSGNNPFGSLGNCVCYKGQPISFDLLGEERAICNTASGYVWGFSSYLLRLGLAFEAAWMACCLICYAWLSLRGGLVRKKIMMSEGPIKFALDVAEAVREIEKNAARLSEDELKARLKGPNVGYRLPNADGGHKGLRHRVVAGLEREQRLTRWCDLTDVEINQFEADVGSWIDETWRRRKPTEREVYEDLNWHVYER